MLEAWPGPRGRLRIRHVPDAERLDYLFPVSQGVSAWRIGEPTIPAQAMALHASGSLLAIPVPISAPVLPRFGWRTLEGWSFSVGEEWTGRLFLIDPRIREAAARRLTFVQTAVRQVGPALFSLFLLQRLHERAGEFARAEVARELHDGVIQSLMGLEMQLAVMQADRHQSVEALQGQIERVRNLLQQEAWNVRSLMEQLRPPAVEPARLVAYLRELVYDFRRRTGISASFVSTVNEVRLPPRLCRELSLLLREALANVRRHSGATSVMVRIDAGRLTVEDNGSGFRFAGALALPALEAAGTGPAMIMESVRAIGGGLIVESRPGSGVTLTVTFSETPRWSGVLR
jgi:signal transduction histidine kinase